MEPLLGRPTSKRDISVREAASFAYGFLFRHFLSAVKLVWLPLLLAGMALYVCLSDYMAELLSFLTVPNPKIACRALGVLSAGVLLALFFYSIAVLAVAKAVLGNEKPGSWLNLRARHEEWLLYAAYLRLLVPAGVFVSGLWFLSLPIASALALPPLLLVQMLTGVVAIGMYWLFVRAGFLLPPAAAETDGGIIRRAWALSASDSRRIGRLVFILLAPGIVLQSTSEYVLRLAASIPETVEAIPLTDYARLTAHTLFAELVSFSISTFVTIVLLTAGAAAIYRARQPQREMSTHDPTCPGTVGQKFVAEDSRAIVTPASA